ncbi:TetR/AcrR family transcriptional regulator [Patulibacter brassicae]|uniref:TetR/AcrR family transcriptional regulator n=1 Tax=Patulibacter brassicae TaxID=1705717 RepID=A0ABU4VN57_9ACTN|nr:TetR/AcrR family transcriptional regulator [Patulibacter brassicae]MDX8153281.1 TetR/AcrR family transcriptional regulator [Patulibacter brassicae]
MTTETRATLADRLLDAAEAEIAEHGTTEISLRAVARRAEVSHQAPGFAFRDRAGLLAALAARGYRYLQEEIAAAREDQPEDAGGRAVLVEMGVAYVRATTRRPALFWLLTRVDVGVGRPELEDARRRAVETLVAAVRAAIADGWHHDATPDELATLAWSTVHGLAVLHRDALGQLTAGSPEETARATMRLLLDR